jgi:hypothetical protein
MKTQRKTESSSLCRALISLLDSIQSRGEYRANCNTPAGLLAALKKHGGAATSEKDFPKNVQRLGMALSSEKAALMAAGIVTACKRDHLWGRFWMIAGTSEFESEDELRNHFESDKARARRLDGLSPD